MTKKPKSRAVVVRKKQPDWAPPRKRVEFHVSPIIQILLGAGILAGIVFVLSWQKKPDATELQLVQPTTEILEILTVTPIPTVTATPVKLAISSVSKDGKKFIMLFEGLVLIPYNDAADNCTIGYGHKLHDGLCQSGTGISEAKAARLFDEDILTTEYVLNDDLEDTELNQCQYDALASFIFNVGKYVWRMSGVSIAVRFGELEEVSYQLKKYIYPSGGGMPLASLEFRRRAEGRLFDECRYRPES